jgi:hypothetical protein
MNFCAIVAASRFLSMLCFLTSFMQRQLFQYRWMTLTDFMISFKCSQLLTALFLDRQYF